MPVIFFTLGFLNNFYPTLIEIILLTLVIQLAAAGLMYRLLGKAQHLRALQPFDLILTLALFLVLTVFVLNTIGMANQFPDSIYCWQCFGYTLPCLGKKICRKRKHQNNPRLFLAG